MKSNINLFVLSTALLLATPLFAEELTGLEIMQLVDARDNGSDLTQKMTQRLVDRRGNVRERNMVSFSKDYE